jgi:signal transduction histidine kinase
MCSIEWRSIPYSAVPELTALCAVRQGGFRLPDEAATTLLHIARETLSNVVKHAGATGVEVQFAWDHARRRR